MSQNSSWTKRIFVGLWTALNFCRKAFFNIIFLLIAGFILISLFSGEEKMVVPKGSALVLNPYGNLVIQKRYVDPLDKFLQEAFNQPEDEPEVLLSDVIFAIDNAREDKRIKALVLDLGGLAGGMDKLEQVARSIDKFKESGKPVYAIGDYYSQGQYYIAAHADKVYLNPMGVLLFDGYGSYGMYFKSMLEKIKATTHIFRVGTYKSFVEPYIRDDMSPAAKEANQAWLSEMWSLYKTNVATARGLDIAQFDEKIESFLAKFDEANGSFAQYALDNGWVDALATRDEVIASITEVVEPADNKRGYTHITYHDYDQVIRSPFPKVHGDNNVAVIAARGNILDGFQPEGSIGGDSTAMLLRKARQDDSVKAVVLYVDSPGGSAFASDIIRREIDLIKAEGKPVVVSMASVAASGGYWISSGADQIWAAPSTITGSIGVFGMFLTFENSLDYLGVHADGVGTTDFSGMSIARPLDPRIGQIFQRSVEHTYHNFIQMVGQDRGMSPEEVDHIAQGRVWIGTTAKEIGLVDELGYLPDAIKAAADLAKLDKFDTKYIQRELNEHEIMMQKLFGNAAVWLDKANVTTPHTGLLTLARQALSRFDSLTRFNDPQGTYAFCLPCSAE